MISLFFAALLVLSDAKPYRTGSEPSFCHGLDCPKYSVVSSKDGYEVRKYEPSKWVGTTITSDNWKSSVEEGFMLLFDYISGANRNQIKVPMASPVATKIDPGVGPNDKLANFTVLFFVPFAYQDNTPIPTNPKLDIVTLPAVTVYVSSFGGFENNEKLNKYASELETVLNKNGESYAKDPYFTAGYDPPYRVTGRHNEVWFLAN